MSRAETILARFPAHFEAARKGKLLGAVAAALARDLDVQAAQLGGIRRAHRVREAATRGDLMRIAALHGIRAREVELLDLRLDLVAPRAEALRTAAPADREAAAAELLALFSLDLAPPFLAAFAPPQAEGEDPLPAEEAEGATAALLAGAAEAAAAPAARNAALSRRIIAIGRNHLLGNGTVRAVLMAAANAIDLDIGQVYRSADRFWHAADATDRLRPILPANAAPGPRAEIVGIEENPLRRAEQPPEERRHAERFEILRKGFDPAPLEIAVIAEADRTVGPMVVNRDQGRGIGFAGNVPPGATLTFTENGRALLGDADVSALAYGFEGAVFADADEPAATDAAFETGVFVETTPPGALDRAAVYPHAGPSLAMPEVGIGRTRMAFFVQEGHFAGATTTTPRTTIGRFAGAVGTTPLGSVFAPGEGETRTIAGLVAFAWREHEAYKARVLIPERLRALDPETEGVAVTSRVARALERARPVGVALEVDFIDDRWTLGSGIIAIEGGESDALAALAGGTVLWPAPAETDPPGPTD